MIRRLVLCFAALALTSVLPALAQSNGPYLGASVGVASLGKKIESLDLEDSVAWKAYAGYSLGRFIALEGGYNDFGSHNYASLLDHKIWGVSGFGILKINIGPIDLFGKLGMVYASGTTNLSFVSNTSTGTGAAYGGGLTVNLGKLGIRAEAEWFDVSEVGKPVTATGGLTIRF